MRFVRWNCTQFCNYNCPYCAQQHDRKQIYRGSAGHWADNRPWQDWYKAFERHFTTSRATFHITGGEPLLDRKNMEPLLAALTASPWVNVVGFDTNGTFKPDWSIDRNKVELQVSFHPSETDEDSYFRRLEATIAAGWRVLYTAFVVHPGKFVDMRQFARRSYNLSIPVHVMPLDFDVSTYTEAERQEFQSYIPAIDRFQMGERTKGLSCRYPTLAYEVDPDGKTIVPCHRTYGAQYHGDLFGELPVLKVENRCPKSTCTCEERYTYIEELNINRTPSPKAEFASRLRSLQCV
jgi:organic radical activating enzyme